VPPPLAPWADLLAAWASSRGVPGRGEGEGEGEGEGVEPEAYLGGGVRVRELVSVSVLA